MKLKVLTEQGLDGMDWINLAWDWSQLWEHSN
jgi:hypothetical protein